ncbi:hypothetical protein HK101_008226 [Irineochytrium annulatum]|nr:hypothetical protein HK101_008226 [Irineochytrium annulatum]
MEMDSVLTRYASEQQPSNKTFKIKRILGKKQKQNRPIPNWIRLRTDNTISDCDVSSTVCENVVDVPTAVFSPPPKLRRTESSCVVVKESHEYPLEREQIEVENAVNQTTVGQLRPIESNTPMKSTAARLPKPSRPAAGAEPARRVDPIAPAAEVPASAGKRASTKNSIPANAPAAVGPSVAAPKRPHAGPASAAMTRLPISSKLSRKPIVSALQRQPWPPVARAPGNGAQQRQMADEARTPEDRTKKKRTPRSPSPLKKAKRLRREVVGTIVLVRERAAAYHDYLQQPEVQPDDQPEQPQVTTLEKTIMFFYSMPDAKTKEALSKEVKELGTLTLSLVQRVVNFFAKNVTHLITDGHIPIKGAPKSTSRFKKPDKTVEQAIEWGITVWSAHQLRGVIANLRNRPAQAPRKLEDCIREEQVYGPSTSRRPDAASGFQHYEGYYFLCEDLSGQFQPIHNVQWMPDSIADLERPPWPKLYFNQRQGKCPFVAPPTQGTGGSQLQPVADSHSAEDEEPPVRADGDVPGMKAKPPLPVKAARNIAAPPQPRPTPANSNASGIISTHPRAGVRKPLQADKSLKVGLLQKRSVVGKSAAQGAAEGGKENEEAGAEAAPVKEQAPVRNGYAPKPLGKAFYYKAGTCENCNENYERYEDHCKTANHQHYANNDANFVVLDQLFGRIKRKKKVVPDSDGETGRQGTENGENDSGNESFNDQWEGAQDEMDGYGCDEDYGDGGAGEDERGDNSYGDDDCDEPCDEGEFELGKSQSIVEDSQPTTPTRRQDPSPDRAPYPPASVVLLTPERDGPVVLEMTRFQGGSRLRRAGRHIMEDRSSNSEGERPRQSISRRASDGNSAPRPHSRKMSITGSDGDDDDNGGGGGGGGSDAADGDMVQNVSPPRAFAGILSTEKGRDDEREDMPATVQREEPIMDEVEDSMEEPIERPVAVRMEEQSGELLSEKPVSDLMEEQAAFLSEEDLPAATDEVGKGLSALRSTRAVPEEMEEEILPVVDGVEMEEDSETARVSLTERMLPTSIDKAEIVLEGVASLIKKREAVDEAQKIMAGITPGGKRKAPEGQDVDELKSLAIDELEDVDDGEFATHGIMYLSKPFSGYEPLEALPRTTSLKADKVASTAGTVRPRGRGRKSEPLKKGEKEAAPSGKRGRPRKSAPVFTATLADEAVHDGTETMVVAKADRVEMSQPTESQDAVPEKAAAPARKRGRTRKSEPLPKTTTAGQEVPSRKRGRPRKSEPTAHGAAGVGPSAPASVAEDDDAPTRKRVRRKTSEPIAKAVAIEEPIGEVENGVAGAYAVTVAAESHDSVGIDDVQMEDIGLQNKDRHDIKAAENRGPENIDVLLHDEAPKAIVAESLKVHPVDIEERGTPRRCFTPASRPTGDRPKINAQSTPKYVRFAVSKSPSVEGLGDVQLSDQTSGMSGEHRQVLAGSPTNTSGSLHGSRLEDISVAEDDNDVEKQIPSLIGDLEKQQSESGEDAVAAGPDDSDASPASVVQFSQPPGSIVVGPGHLKSVIGHQNGVHRSEGQEERHPEDPDTAASRPTKLTEDDETFFDAVQEHTWRSEMAFNVENKPVRVVQDETMPTIEDGVLPPQSRILPAVQQRTSLRGFAGQQANSAGTRRSKCGVTAEQDGSARDRAQITIRGNATLTEPIAVVTSTAGYTAAGTSSEWRSPGPLSPLPTRPTIDATADITSTAEDPMGWDSSTVNVAAADLTSTVGDPACGVTSTVASPARSSAVVAELARTAGASMDRNPALVTSNGTGMTEDQGPPAVTCQNSFALNKDMQRAPFPPVPASWATPQPAPFQLAIDSTLWTSLASQKASEANVMTTVLNVVPEAKPHALMDAVAAESNMSKFLEKVTDEATTVFSGTSIDAVRRARRSKSIGGATAVVYGDLLDGVATRSRRKTMDGAAPVRSESTDGALGADAAKPIFGRESQVAEVFLVTHPEMDEAMTSLMESGFLSLQRAPTAFVHGLPSRPTDSAPGYEAAVPVQMKAVEESTVMRANPIFEITAKDTPRRAEVSKTTDEEAPESKLDVSEQDGPLGTPIAPPPTPAKSPGSPSSATVPPPDAAHGQQQQQNDNLVLATPTVGGTSRADVATLPAHIADASETATLTDVEKARRRALRFGNSLNGAPTAPALLVKPNEAVEAMKQRALRFGFESVPAKKAIAEAERAELKAKRNKDVAEQLEQHNRLLEQRQREEANFTVAEAKRKKDLAEQAKQEAKLEEQKRKRAERFKSGGATATFEQLKRKRKEVEGGDGAGNKAVVSTCAENPQAVKRIRKQTVAASKSPAGINAAANNRLSEPMRPEPVRDEQSTSKQVLKEPVLCGLKPVESIPAQPVPDNPEVTKPALFEPVTKEAAPSADVPIEPAFIVAMGFEPVRDKPMSADSETDTESTRPINMPMHDESVLIEVVINEVVRNGLLSTEPSERAPYGEVPAEPTAYEAMASGPVRGVPMSGELEADNVDECTRAKDKSMPSELVVSKPAQNEPPFDKPVLNEAPSDEPSEPSYTEDKKLVHEDVGRDEPVSSELVLHEPSEPVHSEERELVHDDVVHEEAETSKVETTIGEPAPDKPVLSEPAPSDPSKLVYAEHNKRMRDDAIYDKEVPFELVLEKPTPNETTEPVRVEHNEVVHDDVPVPSELVDSEQVFMEPSEPLPSELVCGEPTPKERILDVLRPQPMFDEPMPEKPVVNELMHDDPVAGNMNDFIPGVAAATLATAEVSFSEEDKPVGLSDALAVVASGARNTSPVSGVEDPPTEINDPLAVVAIPAVSAEAAWTPAGEAMQVELSLPKSATEQALLAKRVLKNPVEGVQLLVKCVVGAQLLSAADLTEIKNFTLGVHGVRTKGKVSYPLRIEAHPRSTEENPLQICQYLHINYKRRSYRLAWRALRPGPRPAMTAGDS